jgi:hypothetical protein
MPRCLTALALAMLATVVAAGAQQPRTDTPASTESKQELERELIGKHGEAQRERLRRGMEQVAGFWRAEAARRRYAGDAARVLKIFSSASLAPIHR